MDTVIRASRLALGRTLLAAHALPGQATAGLPLRASGAAQAVPPAGEDRAAATVDPVALRQSVETQLRKEIETQTRQAIDAARDDARKEGLARGLEEGRAAAAQEAAGQAAERRAALQERLDALQEAHTRAVAAWQADIGAVAFEAICRVVGHQSASREFVLAMVETVCRELKAGQQAVARLHPRDVLLLAGDDASLSLPGGTRLSLVADETMRLGGCVVDTGAGQFDGSLDTQLQRLHTLLCGQATVGTPR